MITTTETLFYHRAFSMMVDFLTDRHYTKMFRDGQNESAMKVKHHILAENPNIKRISCIADLQRYPIDRTPLFNDHYPNILGLFMSDKQRVEFVYTPYYEQFRRGSSQIKLIEPKLLWDQVLYPITRDLVERNIPGEYNIATISRILPQFLNYSGDGELLQQELTNRLKDLQ